MTVQVVRRDGDVELIEDVLRIEIDEKDGERIYLKKENVETSMPCIDFVYIGILRYDNKSLL